MCCVCSWFSRMDLEGAGQGWSEIPGASGEGRTPWGWGWPCCDAAAFVLQEVLPLLPSSGASAWGFFVFLKGREWQQWEPSLCESQLGLSCGPDRSTAFPDSIPTWPGQSCCFSGLPQGHSLQPQPRQEELPAALEPVQNELLLSRAQVTRAGKHFLPGQKHLELPVHLGQALCSG